MPVGWIGEKTRLVPLDKQRHLGNFLLWFNDPELTHNILQGDLPMTRLAEEEWFDNLAKGGPTPTDMAFAVELHDGTHIGSVGMHRIEWRNGVAMTGTLIAPKSLWGKGYASDAVRTRTRYAFEVLNLRLLLSEVYAENVGSLRVLQKNGYKECGRIPKRTWKRGWYRDVIILANDRDDWLAANRT